MNTILQKRIDEAAKKTACPKCVFNDGGTCNNDDDCKLFDDFVGLMTFILQNQWISVEEALPTERDKEDEQYSTNVFAKTKDCIRYAYYDFYNESWCSVEGGYRFGGDVTHWMPIPSLEGGEK